MKLFCALFFLGLAVMPVSASETEQRRAEETGKTYKVYAASDGQVYRDVTVTKITDAGITIIHAEGVARLRHERLSPDQRKKFGITKEGAEAIYAKERKARAAYEAQVAAVQKKRQAERQKAHEVLLAKQTAARLEAERLQARQTAEPESAASIVAVMEVPTFPIIRNYNHMILYPTQGDLRPQRKTSYKSSRTMYPVYYGGTHCYPSRGGYHHNHHRGSYGWINYRRSNFNIGFRW